MENKTLTHAQLLQLKRWNTPTIYNGWEQITQHNIARDSFNIEETHDFMPQMGPMIGYAVTVVIEPSNPTHKETAPPTQDYYRYVGNTPGPKIVIVQDLDKPLVLGSMWGEVNSNRHRSLGCIGTITDGAIRDVDEMTNAGFKAIAQRLCVGHAHVKPIRWNCEVEIFGTKIQPGQLIHADKHGFMAIPPEDEKNLLEAAVFMDQNECNSVITSARDTTGKTIDEIVEAYAHAGQAFSKAAKAKFSGSGEWG